MKIYLINRPCDDSYYPGHSAGVPSPRKKQRRTTSRLLRREKRDGFNHQGNG